MKLQTVLQISLAVTIIFVSLILSGCTSNKIAVVLVNDSNLLIRNIEIEYTGGIIKANQLKSGNKIREVIRPKGESHLELKYVDNGGVLQVIPIDIYFETGYHGEIIITIRPDNEVTWSSNLSIY